MRKRHLTASEFSLGRKNTKTKKKVSPFVKLFNFIIFLFAAAVLGYAFVNFGVQTVKISGPSMEPTLSDGQVVYLNKIIYKFTDVKRGDIVAIKKIGSEEYFDVKRVIAIPNDTVTVAGDRIVVNGESIRLEENVIFEGRLKKTVTLQENEYFVIGDNINHSEDSRYYEYNDVQKSEIKGLVFGFETNE